MGITGLLPLLKSIMAPIHIKELEGCSVAVDTYSWLHKGALSCSKELCKDIPTNRHIQYCMHRVNLLRHYGVKPVLVFDGGLLPMKIEQENKRARSRKENLARAIEHESTGNSAAAYECYQKAVDISPSIARELIQVLKKENICYVVAPYEADAQMTFLAVSGQVDAVVTEDSDLIPFGCPRIIYKMDKYGQGVEFFYSKLQNNKELSFAGFTKQMILEMCILSGCDYLQSLPGMGLRKAHALIKKFKTYDKVIKHLSYNSVAVPPSYEESFRKAILTFQHQLVYNPIGEAPVHLTDIGNIPDMNLDFLGPPIPQHVAKGIAEGDLDPFTRLPFQGENSSTTGRVDQTYHPEPLKLESVNKKFDLPAQKNLITKYFCFASLEAKRKFKAPRITHNYSDPENDSSLSLTKHVSGIAACQTNCYTPSLCGNVKDDSIGEVPSISKPNEYDETVSPEHTRQGPSSLQQSSYPIHKPCVSVSKEQRCKTAFVANEVKIRTEEGKVIVRSRYFQQKLANNIDKNKNDDEPWINDSDADENLSDQMRADTMKRKTSPIDTTEKENLKVKRMYFNDSLENDVDDNCTPDSEDEPKRFKDEKFGANISHLDHYSGIAEKSLEKFVSAISSFRFTGSATRFGSRASGLRPPFKDLQNTTTNRPNVVKDFSEFAYVPKNRKPTIPSRRLRE